MGDTVYNLRIAKRNIRMSNLTPEDVDLRLTAAKAELTEEDQRLWQGLEDEKISRVAGDEANKQLIDQAKQQNSGTESRLSTEVIHRSEGDISNLNSLNAVAQALSDYRIKTDLEINNEIIARKALGVELNTRIDSFVATWDHQKYLIYQAIQDVQDDLDGKYSAMDVRIKKYENMLQNITTDSIQITMDNGEINMGAWTILSQAREWDLQIIAKMRDYQLATTEGINQALEDLQNKLPVEQDIIDKSIQALSSSTTILKLDARITKTEQGSFDLNAKLDESIANNASALIDVTAVMRNQLDIESDERKASILEESMDRVVALQRESAIRQEQNRLLEDGLTLEINERIGGDEKAYTLIENLKVSSDTNYANIREELEVQSSSIESNSSKLTELTSQVQSAVDDAGNALNNSTTALNSVETLATEVGVIANDVTTLTGRVQSAESGVEAIGTAVDEVNIKLTDLGDEVSGAISAVEGIQLTVKPLKASGTWKVSSTKKDASSWSLRYAQIEGDKVVSKQVNTVTTSVDGLSARVQEVLESVNGLEASYTVRIDSNGLVAGFGLYNDSNSSAFAVNADYFYVGKPDSGKKPFMVLTTPQSIGGVTYPAGTWIDVALIASATIGTAHIANAAITTAKIADLAVDNAKIANLNASKINAGTLDANRIGAGSITSAKLYSDTVSGMFANFGEFTAIDGVTGQKTTMAGKGIKVYHPNGQLAVKIGF